MVAPLLYCLLCRRIRYFDTDIAKCHDEQVSVHPPCVRLSIMHRPIQHAKVGPSARERNGHGGFYDVGPI